MMIRTAKARVSPFLCLVACAVSCSSPPTKPSPSGLREVPTGAEFWSAGAMLLPADTPAVLEVHLDRLLEVTQEFKGWLVAEPAMFGEDGPRIVRTVETGWAAATAYLGVDPLSPRAWLDRGVDPARPLYAAIYPVDQVGRRFVGSVDTTIREEIGTAPNKPVAADLRVLSDAGGALPEGTNARILRAVEGASPVDGFRIVVPISSGREFMATATSFAEGMGLRPFPEELRHREDDESERTLYSPSERPLAAIRLRGKHALIDVVLPSFLGPRSNLDPKQAMEDSYALLTTALHELASGRPSAPRPHADALVAVAFDQAAMARAVRLRGYRQGLEELQKIETSQRDAALLGELLTSASAADAWSAGSESLTGTSYELHVPAHDPATVAMARMTMFGRRELPELDTNRPAPSLEVSRHSVGLGIDFALLRDPAWRQWFTGHQARMTDLDLGLVDPLGSVLPGLRVAALLLSSIGEAEGGSGLSEEIIAALGELRQVARVELVSLSPDVGDFRQPPEFLCAAVMENGTTSEQLDALRHVLGSVLQTWYAPGEAVVLATSAPGVTASTQVGELAVHQHLLDTPRKVLLLGVGTELSAFERELQRLRKHEAQPGVIYGRVEPLAFLSWLRSEDTNILRPLEANVLAQRLGAFNLQYQASGRNSVSLEVRLQPPPEL